HYYPFGMQMPGLHYAGGGAPENKYLYNGKELVDDEGIDWYDYGARMYDAALGRFMVQDAYSEKYLNLTPYQYAANNPINIIDINGDSTYLVIYGAGYLNYQYQGQEYDQGDNFKKNAEAHAENIKNRQGYDENRDDVILVEAKTTEQFTDATNATYGSGKIAEMTVFSHGGEYGVSLGGQSPNDPGVTQTEADAQLNDYDKREINANTMGQIDKNNFEGNARVSLYGCNIGGYTRSSASNSFGQGFANYMGGNRTVKAFTGGGGAEFNTRNGDGRTILYTGTMIRSADRSTQQTRLTTFQSGRNPRFP
ncbi:MAG: RHS repeat-associated core domain-containing protein, partial [bacterium]